MFKFIFCVVMRIVVSTVDVKFSPKNKHFIISLFKDFMNKKGV